MINSWCQTRIASRRPLRSRKPSLDGMELERFIHRGSGEHAANLRPGTAATIQRHSLDSCRTAAAGRPVLFVSTSFSHFFKLIHARCKGGSSIHSKRGSGMELDSHYSNPAHSPPEDDWSTVTDPNERRKIQNRNAQRKFREKQKQQREESERTQENQQRAADAYTSPDPDDVAEVGEMSGLPWGGMSLRHIIETGRTKEQSSRESSLNAKISQSGGSSR
nr:apicidin f cluster transcription factor apf2 [Quercus suber]